MRSFEEQLESHSVSLPVFVTFFFLTSCFFSSVRVLVSLIVLSLLCHCGNACLKAFVLEGSVVKRPETGWKKIICVYRAMVRDFLAQCRMHISFEISCAYCQCGGDKQPQSVLDTPCFCIVEEVVCRCVDN